MGSRSIITPLPSPPSPANHYGELSQKGSQLLLPLRALATLNPPLPAMERIANLFRCWNRYYIRSNPVTDTSGRKNHFQQHIFSVEISLEIKRRKRTNGAQLFLHNFRRTVALLDC